MREIEFRGKRIDTGEWAYGDLDQTAMVDGVPNIMICWRTSKYRYYHEVVIPETVGQYTGIKDKNGIKIFEGDIVKITTQFDGEECIVDVVFHNGGWRVDDKDPSTSLFGQIDIGHLVEVIGNIHDNPELAEEAK